MESTLTDQVNKLTRELTQLRAQHSASVASNASHSSAASSLLPVDPNDTNPVHHITGPTHPTPTRRHRSSSSVSARSHASNSQPASAQTPAHTGAPFPTISKASADRAAAVGAPLSRNPSVSAASATSGTSSPARQVSDQHHAFSAGGHNLAVRPSLPGHTISNMSLSDVSVYPAAGSMLPSPALPGTPRNHFTSPRADEVERTRAELEKVKLDNHELRQRVMELEKALQGRRDTQSSDVSRPAGTRGNLETNINTVMGPPSAAVSSPRPGSAAGPPFASAGGVSVSAWAAGTSGGSSIAGPRRERSESQSTTASSRRGPHTVEDKDDVVRVGESAGNAGLR